MQAVAKIRPINSTTYINSSSHHVKCKLAGDQKRKRDVEKLVRISLLRCESPACCLQPQPPKHLCNPLQPGAQEGETARKFSYRSAITLRDDSKCLFLFWFGF